MTVSLSLSLSLSLCANSNFIFLIYFRLLLMVSIGSSLIDVVYCWLFMGAPVVGVCDCSMFCCTLLNVLSSFAIILNGEERAGCFA